MGARPDEGVVMSVLEALEQAYAHTEQVLRGVKPDQLSQPSPCAEWDVAGLIEHTIGSVNALGCVASGTTPQPTPLSDDLGAQFAQIAKDNLAAWSAPGALEQTLNAGPGPMPGSVLAGINLLDTSMHTWDIAKATGQPRDLPPTVLAAAEAAAKAIVSDEIRPGRFDPPQPVADDASPTDKLAAWLGRAQ